MFRMWGKVFADNHLLKDFVVEKSITRYDPHQKGVRSTRKHRS